MKRIEIKEKVGSVKIRGSRTGGVNMSSSPFKGVTLNSKNGLRVSQSFKGLFVGIQNARSVFRGRWSSGSMNVNLSKSGFSLSSKNPLGTINFINPNRSSGKILGLQFRGSKGFAIAGIGALFDILFYLTSFFLDWCILLP